MFVVIDLHDYEEKSHKLAQIEVQAQNTIAQLKTKIRADFSIPPRCQQISDQTGRRIDLCSGVLENVEIRDNDTLILRHSMADNWKAFVECFKLAEKALVSKRISDVERNVDHALDQLRPLKEAKFLVTFPNYFGLYGRFTTSFSRYMDQEFKYIEQAVREYFSKIHDNPECPLLDIICDKKEPEESGVQGGLICQVLRNEELIKKYYVKEHIGVSNRQHADLREIFLYKLFELIQVGPVVHFVPNTHYSCIGLYIATEEVVGFRRADADELQISEELYAQRDLLKRILLVKDLHSKNYGVDGNGRLSIVDFQVKNSLDYRTVHKYLEGYKNYKGSKGTRIRVAQHCINVWSLGDSFEKANSAIEKQKELFRKHAISYKASSNFDDYFLRIKDNLNALLLLIKQ